MKGGDAKDKAFIGAQKKPQKSQLEYVSQKVGRAIGDYGMLADGDRIIVAISGGKDSLSLLTLMKYRLSFVPIHFDLLAAFVDFGLPEYQLADFMDYVREQEIPLHVAKTDFMRDKSWQEVDCFSCSWERRKVLFSLADKLGYNKIALGHHQDDIAETILLNLFYRGEIGAMCPKQELFGGKITIIRPLAYVDEETIRALREEQKIPVFDKYQCPHDKTSQRRMIKDVLARVQEINPNVKKNIINSLRNIKEEYLF